MRATGSKGLTVPRRLIATSSSALGAAHTPPHKSGFCIFDRKAHAWARITPAACAYMLTTVGIVRANAYCALYTHPRDNTTICGRPFKNAKSVHAALAPKNCGLRQPSKPMEIAALVAPNSVDTALGISCTHRACRPLKACRYRHDVTPQRQVGHCGEQFWGENAAVSVANARRRGARWPPWRRAMLYYGGAWWNASCTVSWAGWRGRGVDFN